MFAKLTHVASRRVNSLFKPTLALLCATLSLSAHAHFQLLYTPQLQHQKGGSIDLKMPFTHPAVSGHVMPMGQPEAFYMIKKGKQTDLLANLQPMQWQSAVDSGQAYQAKATLRGLGDYLFVFQPAPYFEASEDIYIQQITKTIVNVGDLPTGWNDDLHLSAEIVPLVKPYQLYTGGLFSGVVKSNGQPVPFAEIEVEFLNYQPEIDNNRFAKQAQVGPAGDGLIAQTIFADANGTFHFPLLKAGQWGFAALGVGVQTEYQGKELSQDAVIWVQAQPLP